MLVQIDKHYLREKTGKSKFTVRLSKALKELGVKITNDPEKKADIGLNIGRCHYPNKARKQILRVGPACISTSMNWKKINHEKAQSVKKADAIVYQSRYSKKIYHKLVCHPDKPETIIFNGADPRDYEVEPYHSNFGINFLASTRVWLKQKRLKYIIRAFLEAEIDDSYLIVCGDNQGISKKYDHHKNILFIGPVSDGVLARLYRLCDAMIHLTYVDACPNSVVEAQVAGLPVICTDQGGTHELIRWGIVLRDKPFKYKPIDLNKPPKVDMDSLIGAMKKIAFDGALSENVSCLYVLDQKFSDLYIDNIARQYISFFEKIL